MNTENTYNVEEKVEEYRSEKGDFVVIPVDDFRAIIAEGVKAGREEALLEVMEQADPIEWSKRKLQALTPDNN